VNRIARYAGVLACALAVTAAGTVTLPLDDHEAFVVQTAQEMRDRGDWIVPYFNGRPRLRKPPLSYWAAAATAEIVRAPRVEPWHGRAASVAGAVGLTMLTMVIAELLTDPRTAVVAGLVAATSTGLFRYAHSARPDMLYAFWCTAVLAAFLWNAARAERATLGPALVAWAAAGLATLTKGPQVPAMLLVALGVAAWRADWSWTRFRTTVRPLPGLLIAAAIAVPWWMAVDRAVPGGIRGTQLGGSLLEPSSTYLLTPYFFYRPLALLLPSIVFLAPVAYFRRWPPRDTATRLLLTLVVVAAIAFSFGPQRRPHYMLPMLPPLSILLARAIIALRDVPRALWARRALPVVWGVTIALDVALAGTPMLWSHDRFEIATLATRAGELCSSAEPILAFEVGGPASSYYAGRRVRSIKSPRRLPAVIEAEGGGGACLLASPAALATIPASLEATPISSGPTTTHAITLVRVRPSGQALDPAANPGD